MSVPAGTDFVVYCDDKRITGRAWTDPDADPLGDLRIVERLFVNFGVSPDVLVFHRRLWLAFKRSTMTKRQFRRWRGRQKAARP